MPTLLPSFHRQSVPARRIGMLSTYPPKLCGLATFAAALTHALRDGGDRVDVVRINDGEDPSAIGQTVVGELRNDSATSVRTTAATLSRCDAVIVQHEYGIFGGEDGDEVLQLLDLLDAPAIVVLHTVPLVPSDHQKFVLEGVCSRAARVVVMTEAANARLCASYEVDAERVEVVAHGAALARAGDMAGDPLDRSRPQLLSWGLLGPGKGIEHVIDAMGLLASERSRLRYTVAGVTHPKVFARCGDVYRQSLMRRAWSSGVAGSVTFDDTYRNVAQLTRFVASSSVVVLPYDSRDQVTSGVLVDAIAAGRPVIATAFPHAVELLASGAGLVVPHGDPAALADAIRSVMGDAGVLAAMTAEAKRIAPSLSWAAVAARHVSLCDAVARVDESVAM
ncbi:MAG: glycosyltransferase [Ilumatobacteraceae bacterium]